MTAVVLLFPVRCRNPECARFVEPARRNFAIPVCFACLPPPPPIPIYVPRGRP